MANLKATTITSGIVTEKTGTTPSPSTTDRSDDLFNSSPASIQYAGLQGSGESEFKPQQMQFDPHNANKFVVVYDKDDTLSVYARLGTIVDKTITWASQGEVVVDTGAEGLWGPQIAFDPSVPNKFIVTYQNMNDSKTNTKVGTISNLTMSFGAVSETDRLYGGSVQFDPNRPGQFCINGTEYNDYKERIRCGQVALDGTGTTISGYGADLEYTANQTTNAGFSTYSNFAYDPNTAGRLVAIWSDRSNLEGNNAHVGYARTLDVSATTKNINITSSTTKFEPNNRSTSYSSIAWDPHNATKFIIAYTDMTTAIMYVEIGTITNATGALSFNAGNSATTNAHNNFLAYDSGIPGKFAVAYNSGTGGSRTGRVLLGTLVAGSGGSSMSSFVTTAFNSTQTNAFRHGCIDFDKKRPGKFLIQNAEGNISGMVRAGNINENTLSIPVNTGGNFILNMSNVAGTIGTFTITGAPSGMTSFNLKVIQSAGPKQFDWGGKITNVKWAVGTTSVYDSGTIPYMSKTDNAEAVDVYSFTTYDDGTTWYGVKEGEDMRTR